LISDFRSAIKELRDSGLPVIPILYCIPYGYFIITGVNPVGRIVIRNIRNFPYFSKRTGSMFISKPTIFQMSRKAGPNANLAILGIGIDLIG
jgi:hypothetical protein